MVWNLREHFPNGSCGNRCNTYAVAAQAAAFCTGAGDGLAFGKTVGRLRYSQRVGFACVGLTPDDGVRREAGSRVK